MTEGLLSGGRVVAVGGGKGGVGNTLIALGIATFIAQLGKKVLLVDAHPRAATLGTILGVARNPRMQCPWAPTAPVARGHETVVPNLRLLEASREVGLPAVRGVRRPRELAARSPADLVLIDLGSGVSPRVVDAMIDADALITVTTPEPTAVEAVYRFVRHAYARRLGARLRAMTAEAPPGVRVESVATARATLRASLRRNGGPVSPWELATAVTEAVPSLRPSVWGDFGRMKVRCVVNASRVRADLELGEAMARVAHPSLGGMLEYLGHVEHDDAVFLAARRRRPLLVDFPASKAARNIERIARRLLSLEAGRLAGQGASPSHDDGHPGPPSARTHYEMLALDRGASDEEIRRAYRKTREIYTLESVALSGLLTDEDLSSMVARVEEARDVLLDPARRRPYDLSITPEDAPLPEASAAPIPPDEALVMPDPALPELTAETEFSGALLRALREARGVRLDDIAARTKIAPAVLRALEDEEFAALPQAVYARGFVTEVAKYLKLDVEQVVRTYMHRYRKAHLP